jgi:hypothetical protein
LGSLVATVVTLFGTFGDVSAEADAAQKQKRLSSGIARR